MFLTGEVGLEVRRLGSGSGGSSMLTVGRAVAIAVDISVAGFSGSGVGGVGGLGGGEGGLGARFFSRLRLACLFLARASDALTYKIMCI